MTHEINTAAKRFLELDGQRNGLMSRLETYARWTVPKLLPNRNRDQDSEPLTHGFQSLGAQAVNHLANKLMMALFSPNRPFFRLELKRKAREELEASGITGEGMARITTAFSQAETEASMELDKRSVRTQLYDLMKMLLVLGNALMILDYKKGLLRILNVRHYVVKRTNAGEVCELLIREKVTLEQLKPEVRVLVEHHPDCRPEDDGCYYEYRWIKKKDEKYHEERWVQNVRLPAAFNSTYTKDRMPYRAVTWDLASGDDYGTGLVEDYEGDFRALSMLSESMVQAAILASEFRWLVNPSGMTTVEDFQSSPNGSALPGVKGDIELLSSGAERTLQANNMLQSVYINRIGAGFMLQSAVTRDSERTTAHEIKVNAIELEGSLGGAYSRIAVDVQLPVSYWTLELIDKSILGKDVEPVIITGLAALSRSADRDRLVSFGQNLSAVLSLPPQILGRLKLSSWIANFAKAEGLDPDEYVYSEQEFQAMQVRAQQQALAMQNASQQIDNQNNPEVQ